MHVNSSSKSTYLLIAGIILVAILIVAGVYFISQTRQQYKTPAEVPSCHNGSAPLPIMPGCERGDETPGCTAPSEGYCKPKGSCFECRFSGDNSLRMICLCQSPTNTPPVKPTETVAPVITVVEVTPTGSALTTPTISPTGAPTATPTTPPIGGPQSSPAPTTAQSGPTATTSPTNPAMTSTPGPTNAPSLPKAGIPQAMYALIWFGAVLLLLGLAL